MRHYETDWSKPDLNFDTKDPFRLIAAGGAFLEMAATQFVINLRYSLMGLSLSQKLDKSFNTFHRMIASFGITDEIFGISIAQKGFLNPWYNYGAILISVPLWSI